eukprot:12898206-Prorocentrum_lima.AAC.1
MRGTRGAGWGRKPKRPAGPSSETGMPAQRGRGTGSCAAAGAETRSGPVAKGSARARAAAA